jgi:formate dehydrogenase subunit delta
MNIEHLVHMANDISAFFDSEAGGAEAAKSVALHISRYWDPRMRTQIMTHAAGGGAGLVPTALAAVRSLPPAPQRTVSG